MIAIPLVMSLFDVAAAEAKIFVEYSTRKYRETDKSWGAYVHMPETADQMQVVNNTAETLRKKRWY